MGRAVKITRRDFTALELRAASAKCTDGARSTSFLGQALELDDAYQTRVVACDARIEAALRRRRDTAARPVGRLPPARHRDGTANAPTFDARAALHAVLGVDLTQIHGLGPSLALKLVGECGTDLSAWPNAKHFTSWLCLTPSNKISGGKVLSTRTRRSGGRAAALLRLAAVVSPPSVAHRRPLAPSTGGCRRASAKPRQSPQLPAGSQRCSTHAAPRDGLRRPWSLILRGTIPGLRPGQPSTTREVSRLRAARGASVRVVSQELRRCGARRAQGQHGRNRSRNLVSDALRAGAPGVLCTMAGIRSH